MDVKNGLTGIPAVIDDHSIAAPFKTVLLGECLSDEEKMADVLAVAFLHGMDISEVLFRYDKDVHRRLGIDIGERDGPLVLVQDPGRQPLLNDLAEQAVLVEIHG